MKTIIISVETTGEIKIEAVGFKGHGCEKAVQALAAAMGGKAGSSGRKPEYQQQQGNTISQGH